MDVQSTLTLVKVTSEGIYGTWGNKNLTVDDEELMLLTFFPDGTYVHNEVYLDNSSPSGAEWGTISIDPQSHKATVSIKEDLNGDVGLSDFENGKDGQEIYFEVSGDTLTLTVKELQDGQLETESFELYRQ